jgi:hypothetical protein
MDRMTTKWWALLYSVHKFKESKRLINWWTHDHELAAAQWLKANHIMIQIHGPLRDESISLCVTFINIFNNWPDSISPLIFSIFYDLSGQY